MFPVFLLQELSQAREAIGNQILCHCDASRIAEDGAEDEEIDCNPADETGGESGDESDHGSVPRLQTLERKCPIGCSDVVKYNG